MKSFLSMLSVAIATALLPNHVLSQHQHDHSMMGMQKSDCQSEQLSCANAATPFLDKKGVLWLVWTAGGKVMLAKSMDMGKTFGESLQIADHGKSLDTGGDARPQIVSDSNNKVFIAYDFFKDKNWNAQINVTRSLDGGQTFSTPRALVNDSSSQRFPNIILDSKENIFLAWIDKRLIAAAKAKGGSAEGGSIAYTWTSDFGNTFEVEKIANPASCECCRIGLALFKNDLPAMVYRGILPGGIRDHVTQTFTSKKHINQPLLVADDHWETQVCPHHGPSLAVAETETMHAAWFTQGKNREGIFYAFSKDGGKHYSAPRQLGHEGTQAGRPYLLAKNQSVWLVWKEFDGHLNRIWMQQSRDDGKTWTVSREVANTMGYSDHPLLVANPSGIYLSWLTRSDGYILEKIGEAK